MGPLGPLTSICTSLLSFIKFVLRPAVRIQFKCRRYMIKLVKPSLTIPRTHDTVAPSASKSSDIAISPQHLGGSKITDTDGWAFPKIMGPHMGGARVGQYEDPIWKSDMGPWGPHELGPRRLL